MPGSVKFPNKYRVIWLDQDIGDPSRHHTLKRAFFSHIDPRTYQELSLLATERDIDASIASDSEIAFAFENDHFTLRTFTEVEPCLDYIEEVQNDRILLIASSWLGEPAVKQIIGRYPNSFVNKNDGSIYSSIYIFCGDMEYACRWAMEYMQYINLFDNEFDLLARMARDLGEEFVDHGKLLRSANQLQDALDRFSWARSMFIRHRTLLRPCNPQTPTPVTETTTDPGQSQHPQPISTQASKPSKLVASVDTLIEEVEKAIKDEQDIDESDQVEAATGSTSHPISRSVADHVVVWFEEQSQSNSLTSQWIDRLRSGMKSHFTDTGEQHVFVFDDLTSCCEHIKDHSQTQAIFLVTSASFADSILTHLRGAQNFIQSLYVLSGPTTKSADVINGYRSQGIPVKLVDACDSLPILILHDISRYYLSKGVHQEKNGSATAARTALSCFDLANQAERWANQLAEVVHRDYLSEIDEHITQTKNAMARRQFSDHDATIPRQQKVSGGDGDAQFTVRTFIVGLDKISLQLDSDIARIIPCSDNDEFIRMVSELARCTPILVVSSDTVPIQVTKHCKVLHQCCFPDGTQPTRLPRVFDRHKSHVYSMDQLMTELYHKLGQHYQNCAVRESFGARDQRKAKRFLEKSKSCYELLEGETKKSMKRYAELLKKTST